MAIVNGDQGSKKKFLNYALPITRIDFLTGHRLAVKHFKLRMPFRRVAIGETEGLGRTVQGAADGSENTLAS